MVSSHLPRGSQLPLLSQHLLPLLLYGLIWWLPCFQPLVGSLNGCLFLPYLMPQPESIGLGKSMEHFRREDACYTCCMVSSETRAIVLLVISLILLWYCCTLCPTCTKHWWQKARWPGVSHEVCFLCGHLSWSLLVQLIYKSAHTTVPFPVQPVLGQPICLPVTPTAAAAYPVCVCMFVCVCVCVCVCVREREREREKEREGERFLATSKSAPSHL